MQPNEIDNLGAQSHVQISFETPGYTADADGMGALRLLEAIRILGPGDTPGSIPQPVCRARLYAYWITVNHREAYDMHAPNGILFNHESPIRGETFATPKISRSVAAIQDMRALSAGVPA